MPAMHRVNSSSIRAVGYDPDLRRLYIRYAESPHVYIYCEVPQWVYSDLMQAGSKGVFVNTHIKPHYEYTMLKLIA